MQPTERSYLKFPRVIGVNDMYLGSMKAAWYAVLTRARAEKASAAMLDALGVEHFLPLVTETRRWSDRIQKVSMPLFASYLFVRLENLPDERMKVLKVPGIVSFVGSANGPYIVPDSDIDNVRITLSHRVPCARHPMVTLGDRVRVFRGLLEGVEGTLIRSGSSTNLVIAVETIQQAFSIHVDSADLEPVRLRARHAVHDEDHVAVAG